MKEKRNWVSWKHSNKRNSFNDGSVSWLCEISFTVFQEVPETRLTVMDTVSFVPMRYHVLQFKYVDDFAIYKLLWRLVIMQSNND